MLTSASGLQCGLPTCTFSLGRTGAKASLGTVAGGGGVTGGGPVAVSGPGRRAAPTAAPATGFLEVTVGTDKLDLPVDCAT